MSPSLVRQRAVLPDSYDGVTKRKGTFSQEHRSKDPNHTTSGRDLTVCKRVIPLS